MIKFGAILFSFILVFSMLGCSKATTPSISEDIPSISYPPTQEQTEPDSDISNIQNDDTNDPVIIQQPLVAVSVPSRNEEIASDDGTTIFQYTYQNMTLTLQDPDVAEKIIIDFLTRIDNTREIANSTALAAQNAYNGDDGWIPYMYHVTYSPVRIDPGVLSLFGANVLYNGAFHPERTCISANYDLITGDVLTLASIMNYNASTDMICQLVISGLREMHDNNYLYSNYEATVKQRFTTDSSQDEAWYFTQTGLCFYFSPYEIAPYSSGVISVEIPYENLIGIIRDEYFPPERLQTEGSATIVKFEDADLSKFTEIAEVVENKDGKMYLVYTENSIQDIRIIVSDNASSYTIFAAYNLSPGQAIILTTDTDTLQNMVLSYKSGNQTLTSSIYS